MKKASSFLPHCFIMTTPLFLSSGHKRCNVGKWVVHLEMFPDHLECSYWWERQDQDPAVNTGYGSTACVWE